VSLNESLEVEEPGQRGIFTEGVFSQHDVTADATMIVTSRGKIESSDKQVHFGIQKKKGPDTTRLL